MVERLGFHESRVRGGYHLTERGDQHITVPKHGNHDLKVGTLRKIRRDVGMTPAEFGRRLMPR
jgi:predicted RNA binding protein YcfA (HicA-like mRNA interferase family)